MNSLAYSTTAMILSAGCVIQLDRFQIYWDRINLTNQKHAYVTGFGEFMEPPVDIGNLGIAKRTWPKNPSLPVDHADQQALRIFGKTLKSREERMLRLRQDRAVGIGDEGDEFCKMVMVIIDRQNGQIHPYLPFHSFFCAA
jgi:hypothetical protein